jgi:hypothetical protein
VAGASYLAGCAAEFYFHKLNRCANFANCFESTGSECFSILKSR